MAPEPTDDPAALDLDRLAELAQLPLTDEEREAFEGACRDLLEAFSLPEVEEESRAVSPMDLREDLAVEPDPETVQRILEAFPRRDGRYLKR